MKKISQLLFFGFWLCLGLTAALLTAPAKGLAYTIETLPDAPSTNDFYVGPAENELFLEPGQTITRELLITNRLGRDSTFQVTLEDFEGSPTGNTSVNLLGAGKGPYPLKDYIRPEVTGFKLKHGERMVLPITIVIPQNAEPGGHYGAVLVSTSVTGQSTGNSQEGAVPVLNVTGRVAAVYLVRVKGEVIEDGFLEDFRLTSGQKFYERGPISFDILFRNNGNVHLNIYGAVMIKNSAGQTVGEIDLSQPWFAMPNSLRLRTVSWDRGLLFGRYTATANINRGYQDIVDAKSVSFWVVPWKTLVPFAVGLFVFIALVVWFSNKFEVVPKKRE